MITNLKDQSHRKVVLEKVHKELGSSGIEQSRDDWV